MPHRKRERELLQDFQANRNILSEALDMLEQAHQLLEHSDLAQNQLVRAAKYRVGLAHEKVSNVRTRGVTTARKIASMPAVMPNMTPDQLEAELLTVDYDFMSEMAEWPSGDFRDPREDHPDTAA